MTTTTAPRFVYLLALVVSFAMAGMTVVLFLAVGPSPLTTHIVPPLLAASASLLFALIWPGGSWRWGIWLSAGFWVFFLTIFISYLLTGELDWLTPARAALVLAAGVVAAVLGAKLRAGSAKSTR
jgi:drug/metabolite transporter (DMT)-like permease